MLNKCQINIIIISIFIITTSIIIIENLSKTILVPELVPKGLRDQRWQRCAVKLRKVPLITVPPPTKKHNSGPEEGLRITYLVLMAYSACPEKKETSPEMSPCYWQW